MTFKKNVLANIITSIAAMMMSASGAYAAGTLIPSANRVDMLHDATRNIIYVTDSNQVLRYDVASGQMLSPFVLGSTSANEPKAQLKGIDISPDGQTLVVADQTSDATTQWVYLINLGGASCGCQTVNKIPMNKEFMENGLWSVAYAGDGSIFASAQFAGSGWVPLRRLDPLTWTWSKVGNAYPDNTYRQNTMLSTSGNGAVVSFAESNISSGSWGRYDVLNASLKRFTDYQTGTSAFNYEIAANSNGTQVAIPTYFGTQIFGANYSKIGTIGQYAGPQPVGVAYHPVENLIYFPWAQTREVKVYDANTLKQVSSYDFEDTFASNGNNAYVQGRTKLSRDGSVLMVTVNGGVRFVKQYEGLSAANVSASNSGAATTISLKGAIGNNGKLSYRLASSPLRGTATLTGDTVTYTPEPGYTGADFFSYTVSYGRATASAKVNILSATK